MITNIYVNGFKTLSKFILDLKPGLNIFVGPNGSGKTNIISFFEFLGLLQNMNVSDAVSSAGGAGSVFRKIGENEYVANIYAKVIGITKIRARRFLYYNYSFTIQIQESGESIRYKNQRLKLKFRTINSTDEKRMRGFDLDLEQTIDNDLKRNIIIHQLTDKIAKFTTRYFRGGEYSTSERNKHIKNIFDSYMSSEESIIRASRYIFREYYLPIYYDISGGDIYNIEPSKAKTPDDSAKKPGVNKDGSGLYSTLYAIQKGKYSSLSYSPFGFESLDMVDTSLSDILRYTQLANEWITNIEVVNNPFDKQLQVKLSVSGEEEPSVLPLSAMSDGTVKWLTLITILLSTRSVFSIEEPENYLHPLMLSEILLLMRSRMANERFILMSTHSETLLNNAEPEEVIVVSYSNGKTTAKRVSNSQELSKEIEDTGFGLGYYYISGSVENG